VLLGVGLGEGLVVLGRGLGEVVVGLGLGSGFGEVALAVGVGADGESEGDLARVESGVGIGVPLPCGAPLRPGSGLFPCVGRVALRTVLFPACAGSDAWIDAAVPAETAGTREALGTEGSIMTRTASPAETATARMITEMVSFLVSRKIPAFQ
jgi:hypothetical protein